MKKNMLAMTACLLASVLAASSCGTSAEIKETEAQKTGAQTDTVTSAAETEPPRVRADLPEMDFGGETVTFFARIYDNGTWTADDLIQKEEDGDVVHDAVYARTRYLEETYNVQLEAVPSNDGKMVNQIRQFITSGESTYDAIVCDAYDAGNVSLDGMLWDLNEVEYLDFSKPWWPQKTNDTLKLAGKQYYATGDIFVCDNKGTRMFYFNKDLQKELHLESPYTLVKENQWTMEKYIELSEAATADLNGDNQMSRRDDRYGTMAQTSFGMILYYASGESLSASDASGMPYMACRTEKAISAMTRISDLLRNASSVSLDDTDHIRKTYPNDNFVLFTEDRCLFAPDCLVHIEKFLRGAKIDIGMVPPPKLDAAQEQYYGFADGWCVNVAAIPITNETPDRAGFLLEAMAADAANNLTPAFYEVALTDKYARDAESVEMLDLILSSLVMDNAEIFRWGNMQEALAGAIAKSGKITSTIEKREKTFEKGIAKTMEQLAAGNS